MPKCPMIVVSYRRENKSRIDAAHRTITLSLFESQVACVLTQIPVIQNTIQVRLSFLILINDEHDIATADVPMENLRIHPSILMRCRMC